MAIGEVFLSAFLQVLFDRLAPREFFKFVRVEGIEKQLRKCKNILSAVQAVLADAEERQMTESAVKEWLHDLRDLAYDLDDVVDELTIEASLRSRLLEEASQATNSSSSGSMIPTWVSNFNPRDLIFGGDMDFGSNIGRITEELEELREQINFLSLTRHVGRPNYNKTAVAVERSPTTSVVGELFHVYGRKEDEAAILNLLCLDEPCGSDIQEVRIIPIVGMGGIGKTTLAQLVYNHPKVENYFDLKAWVCVSDDFNLLRISRAILQSVTRQNGDFKELELIQVQLKEELSKKKFLLVLDDVWNEDYLKWDELSRPFRFGLPGSTIIVTTRHKTVASTMGGSASHHNLKELEHHDGMSLLAQHALGTTNFDACHLDLKAIGEDIVQKCKGLPLAIKALGGLLRIKLARPEEWEDVLRSNMWDFPDRGFPQALLVSYHHLPPLLKDLFAYTSLFPKDYVFDKDELVLLWIAQGLLPQPTNTREHVEEFGCRCFKDLFDRSFFQPSNNVESKFVMHDLMNDLARKVAGETFLGLEVEDKLYNISEKARHFSYIPQRREISQKYADFYKSQPQLRTFLALRQNQDVYYSYLSNIVLHDVLPNLLYLRALSLACYWISEIPDSVGNLKHLRYLNLSYTNIKCLPDSVSSLYYLQMLLLKGCNDLQKLPSSMENLMSLRHLDIAGTSKLEGMPSGIGRLKSLRTLSKFMVGKSGGGGLRLGDLGHMSLLRGSLSITGLENVMGGLEAKEANFKNKQDIDELVLQWNFLDDSGNGSIEADVLDNLRPQTKLKKLEIDFYNGLKFPCWVGDPSFKQVVEVKLIDCKACTLLPPLGELPKLKKVHIKGMHGVKSVGPEFYHSDRGVPLKSNHYFPSLLDLSIEDMPGWEVWSLPVIVSDDCGGREEVDVGQFAHLRKFSMKGCPKLVVVPPRLRLPLLADLSVESCGGAILKSFADLISLTHLRIEGIKGLPHLVEEEDNLQLLRAPLEELVVGNCDELVSLGEEQQGLPFNIHALEIRECVSLEKLPKMMSSIEKLEIRKCQKLVCFPERPQGLPKLRSLNIDECEALESLPKEMSQLQDLRISNCPCLRLFPGAINNLKTLDIYRCNDVLLEYNSALLQDCNMPLLESLAISKVDNSGGLLASVSNFSSLTELGVYNCDDLECFPEGGRCLPTNPRSLRIFNCGNLKCMPRDIQSFTALSELILLGLEVDFLKWGLPPNLHYLRIEDCNKMKPLSEWGLRKLTSLRKLQISGGYEFPDLLMEPTPRGDINYSLLPPSLTSLDIERCPNLESLTEGLQNLTSLQRLWIKDCPKLQTLPHENVLATLTDLNISKCPLLTQRCLKKKKDINNNAAGDYWPTIVYIPSVSVDCQAIGEENSE